MAGVHVVKFCKRLSSSLSAEGALSALQGRGLLQQSTRVGTIEHDAGSAIYVGFDPTADSLHVGNLVTILSLLHFRRFGYQPIAVVGGATGLVGDPSGRLKERDELPHAVLQSNISGITENLERIFRNNDQQNKNSRLPKLEVLNNADWWNGVSALDFVSDISRHFRVGAMLGKESVRQRLQTEDGMNCTEFLYPIFQAYDFLHLHNSHNCWMQVGGSDQWGNITAGCDFVRRKTGHIVHGLTVPLLTTASGDKIGKSAGNAVWLNRDKTSCYQFYQYFVRTTDQDVGTFLKHFTFLPLEEVKEIFIEHEKSPEKFLAQKCLAESVTRLVHGEVGLEQAQNATAVLFGDRNALLRLSGEELQLLFHDAPTAELSLSEIGSERLTIAELAVRSGAIHSLYLAGNMIRDGGLYINFERVSSVEDEFQPDHHLLSGGMTVLRIGKKNFKLVKWSQNN